MKHPGAVVNRVRASNTTIVSACNSRLASGRPKPANPAPASRRQWVETAELSPPPGTLSNGSMRTIFGCIVKRRRLLEPEAPGRTAANDRPHPHP
jgi:hypothetical protein